MVNELVERRILLLSVVCARQPHETVRYVGRADLQSGVILSALAPARFDEFARGGNALRRLRGYGGQSLSSACAASAALRQEHIGASGSGSEGSCAAHRGIGNSVRLTRRSSGPALVDVDL
jgi:hypothetical protein